MNLERVASRVIDWALHTEGSSRTSALIRIGIPLIIWARLANDLAFFNEPSLARILFEANFFAATTLMLLGYYSRTACTWAALNMLAIYYYGGYVLGIEPWTHHHISLLAMATALSALTPCGKSYSLDRYFAVRKAQHLGHTIPAESGNLWGLRLMSLQLSIMYLGTAFDKTSWAFLGGDRLEALFMYYYSGSTYPDMIGFHALMIVLSILTVALDYILAFGLIFEATRKWLIIPGLIFHGILYLFLPVFTFTVTVWLLYLAYLNADKVHAFIDTMHGYKKDGA